MKKGLLQGMNCHCLNIRRAANVVTKFYNQKLLKCGITIGQYAILKQVKYRSPLTVNELANEIGIDRTTLVRNLKPMEEQQYVLSAKVKGYREKQLFLTAAGEKRFQEADAYWIEAQLSLEDKIGSKLLEDLTKILFELEELTD